MSMFLEIMVAHVATQTQRIRVETGGVMLLNHSAFDVAERFAMLEALYRRQFKPSEYLQEPKSILSIMVFTAETDEEAYYQAAPTILH